jgi:hypothetical protein
VWISFSRHSPDWRVVEYFHSPSHQTIGKKSTKGKWEVGKILARLASGFVFWLANREFYSHLASWRVVIRTPDVIIKHVCHVQVPEQATLFVKQNGLAVLQRLTEQFNTADTFIAVAMVLGNLALHPTTHQEIVSKGEECLSSFVCYITRGQWSSYITRGQWSSYITRGQWSSYMSWTTVHAKYTSKRRKS